MKYLTLIRHAKASREKGAGGDIDRVLNDRGREDSGRMGTVLGGLIPPPEMVLSSPAQRARETLKLLLPAAEASRGVSYPTPEEHRGLYLAEADELWDFAYSALMEFDEVWLCGHNPGIAEAVSLLAGVQIGDMPTLGVARIAFEEILPTSPLGELYFYDIPKNHRTGYGRRVG